MPPTSQSDFEVNIKKEIAVMISSIALGILNARVYHQDTDTIVAKKGMSFRSNGEVLEVHKTATQTDTSKISVISRSAWSSTLIDWGINAENIQRFEQLVRQLINLVKVLEKA